MVGTTSRRAGDPSANRAAWHVQRLFWFDWRDPSKTGVVKCSFCASAGLLRYNRTPKPAYQTFKFYANQG